MNSDEPFRLIVPQTHWQAVLNHAKAESPRECVGFMIGRVDQGDGLVSRVLPLVNELASPTAFRTEARSLFRAYAQIRETGTELLAIYHSHPAAPAVPSQRDRTENTYGNRIAWVIVGHVAGQTEVRAWWLDGDRQREATMIRI